MDGDYELYSVFIFTDVPELDRLPRSYRVMFGLMSRIPVVRDMGRILRYRFCSFGQIRCVIA